MISRNAKPIKIDEGGSDTMVKAVRILLNQFPGLPEGEEIKYEDIGEDSGICFSRNTGALVYDEETDVIGNVKQLCQYTFYVVYRSSGAAREKYKIDIEEFLEILGRWLCGETVTVNGIEYKLTGYPQITYGRTIKKIKRDNTGVTEPNENGVQDWLLPVTVEYTNQFEL